MTKRRQLPLLWFLTGTIGDALMALALSEEIAALNPGVTSVLYVRREPKLVADLAMCIPSIKVIAADFSFLSLIHIAINTCHRWQIMSAWHSVGLRKALRSLFLLNPGTRIGRFDMHAPATRHDLVAPYDEQKLVIDNFRVLAQTVGFKTKPLGSQVSLRLAPNANVFGLAPRSYVVLHPFGSNETKSLPPDRVRGIILALSTAYPDFSFVITGGKGDAAVAQKIAVGLPNIKLAIGLPILDVAGLIADSAFYIGVDTGITHLAAMMGKPMLALEHPTIPRWFPTYNPNTVMLIAEPDPRSGIWGISDERVLQSARTLIHE